jgi:signal peptidase I
MKRNNEKKKSKDPRKGATNACPFGKLISLADNKAEGACDSRLFDTGLHVKEENGSDFLFNYYGVSMKPTFKAGDGMMVLPYGRRKIRPGDVIVFRHPEKGNHVVHRVVRVDSKGIMTCGDNSILDDSWILSPENVIGRVVSVKRAGRNLRIRGGRIGGAVASMLRFRKRIDGSISKALHPLYQRLARSGIFHGWLSSFMKMKLFYFKRPYGTEIQLMMGKWIIGRYIPQQDTWQIRRPFRLFIDTSALPKGVRCSVFSVQVGVTKE